MGGIKNRDKKRLQNNVFTSGGGGGSKGPAVVDKRNQETRCPYCDKVFKQSGRLKEHVASKHAEEAAVAEGASSSQSSAGPAPSASQGEQGKADRQGAAAAAKGKMMEVGSRAGYYTTKSPKMLLHELCQREGQPKPRYRTRPQDSGAFSCKVVVPHGKDANKDVVVFLGDEHLADSEEEAQQRAAVAALHRLQSNRSLERVLPSQYVGMWKALEASAKQRAERQAAAEDRARERAERERRRSEMERRREPKAVVMSSEKQRLVQELLLDDAPTPLAPAGSLEHRADSDEREGCEAQVEQAKQQLLGRGFSAADADAALRAVAGRSAGVQLQEVYEMALDLMVLKLPEDRLPAAFKGPSTNTINILHQRTTQAAPPAGQPGADADGDRPVALRPLQEEESSEPGVAELSLLGYDREDAEAALAACGGDAAGAWRALFLALLEQGGAAASEERAEGEGGTEAAWEEEVQVLQAIYGNDVVEQSVGDAPRRMALRLQAGCGELQLKLLLPVEPGYPYRVPVFGLQSQAVPSSVLREATRRVGEAAVQLLGQPMVHELAEQAVAAVEVLEGRRVGRKVNAAAVEEAGPEAAASGGGGVAPAVHASADAEAGTEVRARQPGKGRAGGGKRGWTPRQEAEESRRLQQHQQAWNAGSTEAMRSMRSRRRKLPAHGQRSDIVSCVVRHQVVVLSGMTGCGKSTQVPQFILEDAVERGRGGACNIICTQPRRLSAMSLAARVAQERCETLGSSVGYSVRLDSCSSAQTRLLFCTTGILLRRLISDRSLTGVSHVIVDEVHERSLDSDLLLLLLRDLLASGSQLQLVLMSATADSALFAEYFGCGATGAKLSVGTLTIPGFTYPVREMYLEDVLEETGFAVGPNSKWAKAKQAQPGGSVQLEAAAAAGGPLESEGQYSAATLRSLQLLDEELLNYSLLERLVACILSGVRREGARAFLSDWREAGQGEAASDAGSGALLVFLPGMMEIQRLAELLTASADVRSALGGEKLQVLPLHGSLPAAQQARVFNRPGPGCHKVILSTNIAETSVTIDDITMVVDAGRLREVQYDAERGISALTEAWVSQASAQQRRGRAGRVRAGVCWRLFSRAKWLGLAKQQAPEICRMPLEALCLNVKAVLPQDSVRDVLRRAITPPPQQAVEAALLRLAAMRALDRSPSSGGGEMLTALGRHIVRMPADPRVAKMLVFAALLRCLSPVLTVAAAMLYGRPIFLSPPDKRGAANDTRAALLQPVAGAKSDHIAIVLAYGVWRRELGVQGRRAASQWCSRSFVSEQAMEEIHRARLDLARQLQDLGFASRAFCDSLVSGDDLAALSQMAGSRAQQDGVQEEDANAGNSRFLKAAVCAGFYPSILRVEHPQKKYKDVSGGTVAAENAPSALKFFDREKGRVFLHPSSVNFSAGEFASGWLIVTQMMQTSKVFVRECSMVPLYAILLFGGELSADLEKGIVKVDGWATFQAPARIAVFVKKLRQQLDGLLSAKLADPELRLADLPQIRVLEQLLASDGF